MKNNIITNFCLNPFVNYFNIEKRDLVYKTKIKPIQPDLLKKT